MPLFSAVLQPAKGAPPTNRVVQRCAACGSKGVGECESCRKKRLQRKPARDGGAMRAGQLDPSPRLTEGGERLSPRVGAWAISLHGGEFSGVRIHDDATSHAATREIDARAFTLGQHIHFAAGEYQPETTGGLALLAHELTHTAQQRGATDGSDWAPVTIDPADSPREHEANQAADRAMIGRPASVGRAPAGTGAGTAAGDHVARAVATPGQRIDASTRAPIERSFGQDFGGVRLHTGPAAADSAQRLGAAAYALGDHIVVGAAAGAAGDSPRSRWLMGHELAHVAQQRQPGAAPTIQRVGFFEALSRLFFEGTFSDLELLDYVKYLDDHAAIEGDYDSDNKAREIIRRWSVGDKKFPLTLAQRKLMLLELIDGPTLDADEHAILLLLRGSKESEVLALIGTAGGEEALSDEFQGSESDELDAFLAQWHKDPAHRPVEDADLASKKVRIDLIEVNQTTPEVVTVHYRGGRVESETCSSGKGTCCVDPGTAGGPSADDTRQSDTNWTPIGVHTVKRKLDDGKHPRYWTEIHTGRAIALHAYHPVDGTPLSHGCVRLHESFAKRIFDGSRSVQEVGDRATKVEIKGIPRPRCDHDNLVTEWQNDFSEGATKSDDGEVKELRQHLRVAFHVGSDKALDEKVAAGVIPRCPGGKAK